MIRRIVHVVWHELLEFLTHLRVLTYFGIISLVIGFALDKLPEELASLVVKQLPATARAVWPSFVDFPTAMILVGVGIIIGDIATQKIKKAFAPVPKISANLGATQGEGIQKHIAFLRRETAEAYAVGIGPGILTHVALVRIVSHNAGKIPHRISRVEFVTKGHWDIPDPTVMDNPVPVVSRLGCGHPATIKISPEVGTRAARAVGKTLQPGKDLEIEFLLITDHSPRPAMGIFPFHLGVELVHGARDEHLSLPDLLVSLHGQAVLSYNRPQPRYAGMLGDTEHFANAALSQVNVDVICPPALVDALKLAAR